METSAGSLGTARAVAFADLAGFTALTEVHGDDDAADLAETFCALARESLTGSTLMVKSIDDAVMLAGKVVDDVVVSIGGLLDAMSRQELAPDIRAGIAYGPVTRRGEELFGTTVNVAARITSTARPGQVVCTSAVVEKLTGRYREAARLVESRALRHVEHPVDVYELVGEARTGMTIDPVCHMRVPAAAPSGRLDVPGGGEAWFCSADCLEQYAERLRRTSAAPVPSARRLQT